MNIATLVVKITASKDYNVELSPKGLGLIPIYKKGDTLSIYMATGYASHNFFYGILRDTRLRDSHIIQVPLVHCTEDKHGSSEKMKYFVVSVNDKLDPSIDHPIKFLDDAKGSHKNQILATIRKLNKA